jgi:PAS domain S-box-containing protein
MKLSASMDSPPIGFPSGSSPEHSTVFDVSSSDIASKLAASTILVGVSVLLGWVIDSEALKTLGMGESAMKANAAFGFVLAGASLWLQVRRSPRPWQLNLALGGSVAVFLLGVATLAQYTFHWNLHIDELLFTDRGLIYLPAPGRPAPASAVAYLLVGGALCMLRSSRDAVRAIAQVLLLAVVLLSVLMLVGYAYGVSSIYNLPSPTSMALPTAAAFAMLSAGALYARRDFEIMAPIRSESPGGTVARTLLPVILLMPLLGWLRMKGEQVGLYESKFGLALSTTFLMAILIGVVWWCARSLNRVDGERQRISRTLRKSEHIHRAIGESIDYGIWLCDATGKNTYASPSFLKLVGLSQQQCAEFGWGSVLHPDDADRTIEAWKQCVVTMDKWDVEHRFRGVDGNWHSVLARGGPVTDEQGQLLCWAGINLDISRLKQVELQLKRAYDDLEVRIQDRTAQLTTVNEMLRQSLQEKEVLLREVHHRVKNNLQVVSSLLHLQSLHTYDQASAEMFQESQHRVRSMALVHERLYRSNDLAQVDFTEYVETLASSLFQSYKIDGSRINLETNVHEVRLAIDTAIPCGLLINELVSNCLKHAFVGRDQGRVRIELMAATKSEVLLSIADDGIGLAPGIAPGNAKTFGMQVIAALVDQLHGELEIRHNGGTEVRILFPELASRN